MYRVPSASSLPLALLLVTPITLITLPARAADDGSKQVCLSTYVQAQTARQEGKLRASQASLVQCGRAVCPVLIRDDCVRWLREVTEATPTVVLSATGPDGRDRSDVSVRLDGQPLVAHLDGRPVAVDPGEHVFRFELEGSGSLEEHVLLHEAEHDRAVTGVFPRPAARPASIAPGPESPRPVPAATWILGGVGATSLLVASTFAAVAWFGTPGWSSSQSCRPSCPRGDVDTVQQRFAVADVTGAVGLLSLGAAAYFFFTRPERPAPPLAFTLAPRAIGVGLSTEF